MTLERDQLIALCRFGWAIPIMAALGNGVAPRLHTIRFHLGNVSRDALSDSVEHLIKLGILVRAIGHGHPLRPEFHVTETGNQVVEVAKQLWASAQACEASKFARLRWGLPLLHVLQSPKGFGELKSSLPPVTDRALSIILKQGQAYELVGRTVVTSTYPPTTLYMPLDKAKPLCEALAA